MQITVPDGSHYLTCFCLLQDSLSWTTSAEQTYDESNNSNREILMLRESEFGSESSSDFRKTSAMYAESEQAKSDLLKTP